MQKDNTDSVAVTADVVAVDNSDTSVEAEQIEGTNVQLEQSIDIFQRIGNLPGSHSLGIHGDDFYCRYWKYPFGASL